MSFDDHLSACPRCGLESSTDEGFSGISVCSHCGYMPADKEKSFRQTEGKRLLKIIIISGIVGLAIFIHVINWDHHSLAIVPLKLKSFLGMASNSDLIEIANICEDRLKYECTESALRDLSLGRATVEDRIRLATLRRRLGNYNEAITTFQDILKTPRDQMNASQLADTYFGLAQSYEKLNNTQEALASYARSIEAKPEVIQVTVTEAYINLLKNLGRTDEAKAVIAEARKRGHSESFFANLDPSILPPESNDL